MAALTGDLKALRDYVTASGQMQNRADGTVLLSVTHSNLKARFMEIRFDRHALVSGVKSKLCFHTGTNPSAMRLCLRRAAGGAGQMLEDDRMLGYYSPCDGDTLHVEDTDVTSVSRGGWLEDTSKVEKYVMREEDYNSREGTYRKYKEAKLREDPTWTLEREMQQRRTGVMGGATQPLEPSTAAPVPDDGFQEDLARAIDVGSRCEVQGGKRGEVQYVGRCKGLPPGYWIGVKYDEPVGKNDGSIKGHRYFSCAQGYGGFVRPALVTTGDLPPHDDDFEFSDEDEV